MVMQRGFQAPTDLVDAVAYQEGAIVSQAIVKAGGGTVTLFAFDAGEGLSEHTAPYDALVLALDGSATVSVAGASHRLNDGQIVLLPANIPHAVATDQRFKMLLIMMRQGGE
ncbi:MAG: cupin domain-containing protein [Gemmatimonadota bacterium]|nr:cupin domain-containing protein [Gemmatimonadota bacterium]